MRSLSQIRKRRKDLVPVLALCLALSAIVLIPLKIIGCGYLPYDDTLSHSAKIISGKNWNEILVMRSDIKMDYHPGWHAILGSVHKLTGCDQDGLAVFSIVALFIMFCAIPFFFLEHPEAWLVTMLIMTLVNLVCVRRLFYGRPYIFAAAVVLVLSLMWKRLRDKKFPYKTLSLLTALIALAIWVHSGWYLFAIPLTAFLIAREWRASLCLSIAIASGIFLGALFTGHPYLFLKQDLTRLILIFADRVPQRLLVDELQPFNGEILTVIVVCGLMMWRYMRRAWNKECIDNPVFILAASCWIMGFFVWRFWLDWGIPALMVWMALEFQDAFKKALGALSWRRLLITGCAALALFAALTNDSEGRWTYSLKTDYLSQDNSKQKEWLPEPGGIIYSDDMGVFYQTFFKNPKAPWRYMLGYEPALMPPDDAATYFKIRDDRLNRGANELFRPWVKKMKPADRLIIRHPAELPPKIAGLEWCYAADGTWIGRLPRNSAGKRTN